MATQTEMDDLFAMAMKGQWNEVVEMYRKIRATQTAKITKSDDTALHIAVSVGQTETAVELVDIVDKASLNITNVRGNTALHVAAALGNLEVCESMVKKNSDLRAIRNNDGEIPLFLAALNGKEETFHFLDAQCTEALHVRRNNGDTILHAAIAGEYFSLAMNIITVRPELVNSMNEDGLSPLHILANKPNAFKSSTPLGFFDGIIYKCYVVDDLKEERYDVEAYVGKTRGAKESQIYPQNYETCKNFLVLLRVFFQVLCGLHQSVLQVVGRKKDGNDEENPQEKNNLVQGTHGASTSSMSSESEPGPEKLSFPSGSRSKSGNGKENASQKSSLSQGNGEDEKEKATVEENASHKSSFSQESEDYLPPNYGICVYFFKFVMKAMLIILGIGSWKINEIRRKKRLHMWADRVMNKLVEHAASYKSYEDTGRSPGENFCVLDQIFEITKKTSNNTDVSKNLLPSDHNNDQKREQNKSDVAGGRIEKRRTPILVAAKMGVVEIVDKILDEFPVAIQDVDSNNKNVVLLAAENRQPQVYNLLLNKKIPKESVFRQLDNEGHSALHLAARGNYSQPWFIPGGVLQMQCEIRWYKIVEQSMPPDFFSKYNMKNETPLDVFNKTHKQLIKDASDSLSKTSESCSVVAAVVASVVFATSTTVPGGVEQASGIPVLKEKPAFDVFAISSLVALCSSVTALVFFLSILAYRHRYQDFDIILPRKLLLAFTSLFISIASMLLSFFAGHTFIVNDELRYIAYPLYAALCFPFAIFAREQLSLFLDLISATYGKFPQQVDEIQSAI